MNWLWELVGAVILFLLVSVVVGPAATALGPSALPLALVGMAGEAVVLWRLVWTSLALLSASSVLPRGLAVVLSGAVSMWGTKSARQTAAGLAAATVITGGIFSGVAVAAPADELSTEDFLWEADTQPIVQVHPLEVALPLAPAPVPVPADVEVAPTEPSREGDEVKGQTQEKVSVVAPVVELPRALPDTPAAANSLRSRGLTIPDRVEEVRDEPHRAVSSDVHTVVAGESLWVIAADLLGPHADDFAVDAQWREIYRVNREVVGEDPDHIEPGMRLELADFKQN